MKKEPLGRGLKGMDILFSPGTEDGGKEMVITVPLERVYPDENQHRKTFHDETLKELADSIRIHGVIQPLLVRKFGAGYQIIAGERRYRASRIAGLKELPVIVKDLDEKSAQEAALIENLQREDLDPIDEAGGYAALMHAYNLTQEEAAKQMGKSRAAVANALRLLNLPPAAQSLLKQGIITAGHARALLPLKDEALIGEMLLAIVDGDLSVRQVEEAVKNRLEGGEVPKKISRDAAQSEMIRAQMKEISQRASASLGRKVNLKDDGSGRGKITLEYFDSKDLEEILSLLCGEEFLLNF